VHFTTRTTPPSQLLVQRKLTLKRLSSAVARGVDDTVRNTVTDTRAKMVGAGLGKLSRAVRYTSDVKKRRVPDIGDGRSRWRVGGAMFAPGRSERTQGALAAYSQANTTIVPRRGRWLAFATDEIPQRVGRYKMTPALYEAGGFDRKIGELEFIQSKKPNEAFLIARDVQVNAQRGFGQARRLPRHGKARQGKKAVGFIVAFILIRVTRRSQRFNPKAIMRNQVAQLPRRIRSNLRGSTQRAAPSPVVFSSGGSFSA